MLRHHACVLETHGCSKNKTVCVSTRTIVDVPPLSRTAQQLCPYLMNPLPSQVMQLFRPLFTLPTVGGTKHARRLTLPGVLDYRYRYLPFRCSGMSPCLGYRMAPCFCSLYPGLVFGFVVALSRHRFPLSSHPKRHRPCLEGQCRIGCDDLGTCVQFDTLAVTGEMHASYMPVVRTPSNRALG